MITRPRKPYSEGLRRRRIVRAIQGDMVKSAAAGLVRVSLSCVKRCMRIVSRGGASLEPRKGGGSSGTDHRGYVLDPEQLSIGLPSGLQEGYPLSTHGVLDHSSPVLALVSPFVFPYGRQAGKASSAGSSVSWVRPEPSAFIT